MTTDAATKTRENQLRRVAARRGLTLSKARRIDPGAVDYNLYALIDDDGKAVNPPIRALPAQLDPRPN